MRISKVLLALLLPLIAILAFLLWPLASREWAIRFDEEAQRRKEAFLTEERRRIADAGDSARNRQTPPNVVLIVADDLSRNDVGFHGHPIVRTPHMDALAAEGVTFTEATATTSICAPSRAALLTGRYQQRFGFEYQPHTRYPRNRLEYLVFRYLIDTSPMVPAPPGPVPRGRDIARQGLPPSELTLAELLHARGYRTAAYGKWHLGYNAERFSPLEFGFDEHYGFYEAFSLYAPLDREDVVDVRIDDFSDRHMWSQGRSGPSAIVHNDVVVTESRYLTDVLADRAVSFIRDGAEPFFLYLPFSAPHTPLQAPAEYWDLYPEVEDPVHRAYYAMISNLDSAVGEVLDALEESGVAENTLVILTSDNGGVSYLGVSDNGPLAAGKFSNFEGGLAVPLVMRLPGRLPAGSVVREPVSLLDIMPTVAAATGRRPAFPAPLDGENLLAGPPDRSALFWRSGYNLAVRSGDWKLQIDRRDGSRWLYNLRRDPAESSDLSSRHPRQVERLRDLLGEWEAGLAEKRWPRVMDVFFDVHGRRHWFGI